MKPQKVKEPECETWDHACTLYEWAETMLRSGHDAIVKNMIRTLPETSRGKYRELWARIKEERKNGVPS